ncbi:four-carbon acid sugar kinase family protein [uncultured Cloacibacillus sp.]|uniref:four-carbon acid sugar kinase family protein n=1 Tax=uncultured Cloacibacillus sp. TaxID=889794 RepID=UPI0026DDBF53|nr:four-carbon acid sugar kinase family protein [uncultured Cloacibacillus sp.]
MFDERMKLPLESLEEYGVRKPLDTIGDISKKIIVLDDDPTGTQTVHDVSVYTSWDIDSIRSGFREKENLFYIMTNSRAMTPDESRSVHEKIVDNVLKVSEETNQEFMFISRSDSTLRGHYPLETETLRRALGRSGKQFDGEIICPFFNEGGRYTFNDIHYVKDKDWLVPAAMTEFAKDKSFGYSHSHLGLWCEERTHGRYKHEEMIYLPVNLLHNGRIKEIEALLLKASGFNKIIVNAVCDYDVQIFIMALLEAAHKGKNYIIRSAAAVPRVLGNITPRPLLTRNDMVERGNPNGGIIIIGSHVNLTTRQVETLRASNLPIRYIEFNQHLALDVPRLMEESKRVRLLAEKEILAGNTVVICTRRNKIEIQSDDPNTLLNLSNTISDALVDVIAKLAVPPSFIVSKGGVTSSDVGKKGLKITRARVIGQVLPGIPVWQAGDDSKFPGMAYVVFPGNVGDDNSLLQIVTMLMNDER